MKRLFLILMAVLVLPVPCSAAKSLDGLPAYMHTVAEVRQIPGMVVAIVQEGQPTRFYSMGVRRTGGRETVGPDTIFQIGSTSKAFTSALTAMLVDEGALEWTDRVVDHFPEFRMHDPWVTREFQVFDLYAQHSGMQSYAGDLQAFLGFGREHIVHSLRHIPPRSSFRSQFSYVNNLFIAGGLMMEAVTGKTWEELLQQRILDPLGMTRTNTTIAGIMDDPDHATPHTMGQHGPQPLKRDGMLLGWTPILGPAGGINSTARDMSRWLKVQMANGKYEGGELFSENAARFMHGVKTPFSAFGADAGYCLGWTKLYFPTHTVISHNGATSGSKAFVGWSPEAKAGVVVLTNLSKQAGADAVGLWALDRLAGAPERDWAAEMADENDEDEPETVVTTRAALPLKRYAGIYRSPVYDEMDVSPSGKGLRIRFGKDKVISLVATHAGGDSFVAHWPAMDPEDPDVHFDFIVDGEGSVRQVLLREFDQDDLTTWFREPAEGD